MSNEPLGNTTRRGFLGTATAATALTLGTSPGAEAQTAPIKSDEVQVAQLTTTGQGAAPAATATPDWTKPAAMAIPKEGYFKVEQGRYGPIFPRTPANHGFSILAKVKPGREAALREYGNTIEKAVAANPGVLGPLKLHYLRWLLFEIKGETYFMYQGIFDTDFDKYIEDAVALFTSTGITTAFVNLEGFPENWQGNVPVWNKFFRDHQCPSFLEYAEYPYVTADEVKKALRVKSSLSTMLDQMQ
jgi:hypothetical protein